MPAAIDPLDLIGSQFGALTVRRFLRLEPYSYGRDRRRVRRDYIYTCECRCGKTNVEARRVHLLTGHKGSCGCLWKPTGGQSGRWTGHGEISGVLWSKVRNHARYRGLEFNITIEAAWDQFLTQGRCCALTGLPLSFGTSTQDENTGGRTASLDRIDSRLGYEVTNIQWVHKDINLMKLDLPEARFIELCQAVAAFKVEGK